MCRPRPAPRSLPLCPKALVPLLVALALCAPSRPAAAAPGLSAADAAKLKRWEVVARPLPELGYARSRGVIPNVPEASLYASLGIARYRFWVPNIKASRFVKRSGPLSRVGYAVVSSKLPWPVRDAWAYIRFRWDNLGGRRYRMSWTMINGTMKRYGGVITIEPWTADAAHSLVTFRLLVEPKSSAPASVIRRGVRQGAALFIHRLRMRVAALRKYKKLPADLLTRYRAK